ncbi:MAG: carbon-nitrogen hydrolase family protein [Candidatus Latescibacterota bacterium]
MVDSVGPPRKVVVGAAMFAMWGPYPGLEKRLQELCGFVDEMAAQARSRHGRGLDLAALPEVAVTGGLPLGPEGAVPLEGAVRDAFAATARRHACHIVVPLVLRETPALATNACVLLDRGGEVLGIYRKVHVVAAYDGDLLENGTAPGRDFPVFQTDFGRVGIQICWDIAYDDGWETLARKGAEVVVWSTQSPGQINAACRAWSHGYFVLTSTWRHNASLLDPTGHRIACITRPEERVLVEEIDLAYRIVGWQPGLDSGRALGERYGERVGYRYSEAEDHGIFWSNDPATPVDAMLRALDLTTTADGKVEHDRRLQDAARGGPPLADAVPLNPGATLPGSAGWREYWGAALKG